MPTENERKYVLRPDCLGSTEKIAKKSYKINQAYLIASKGISVRIRRQEKNTGDKSHVFTLKSSVNGRVVEIEKKIDVRDFKDLWKNAYCRVYKVRHVLNLDDERWEVDFFLDPYDKIYFCVAEVEMPEGREFPNTYLPLLRDNLLYEVPLNDSRFSNKILGDVRYANELLKEIYDERFKAQPCSQTSS